MVNPYGANLDAGWDTWADTPTQFNLFLMMYGHGSGAPWHCVPYHLTIQHTLATFITPRMRMTNAQHQPWFRLLTVCVLDEEFRHELFIEALAVASLVTQFHSGQGSSR